MLTMLEALGMIIINILLQRAATDLQPMSTTVSILLDNLIYESIIHYDRTLRKASVDVRYFARNLRSV